MSKKRFNCLLEVHVINNNSYYNLINTYIYIGLIYNLIIVTKLKTKVYQNH